MRNPLVSFLLILGLFAPACGARQVRVRAVPAPIPTVTPAEAGAQTVTSVPEPAPEATPDPGADTATVDAPSGATAKQESEPVLDDRYDGIVVRAKAKTGRRVRSVVREASDLPANGVLTDAAADPARQRRDSHEADATVEADRSAEAVVTGFLEEALTAKPPTDQPDKGASPPAEQPGSGRDAGFLRHEDVESLAALGRLLNIFVFTVFALTCLIGIAIVLRRGRPFTWPHVEDSSFRSAPSSNDETLTNGWFEEGPATDREGAQSPPAPSPALIPTLAASAAPPLPIEAASPPTPAASPPPPTASSVTLAAPSAPAAASAAPPALASAPPTPPTDDVRAAARPKLFLIPPPAEPPPAPPNRLPAGSGHHPYFDLTDVNGEIEIPAPKPPPRDLVEILPSTVLIDDETPEDSLAPSA